MTFSINKLHPASAHLLDVKIFQKIKLARSPFHTWGWCSKRPPENSQFHVFMELWLSAKEPVEEIRIDWQGQPREKEGRKKVRRRANLVGGGMVSGVKEDTDNLVDRGAGVRKLLLGWAAQLSRKYKSFCLKENLIKPSLSLSLSTVISSHDPRELF